MNVVLRVVTTLALAAFCFCAAANAQIEWISWDPVAIRADRTEPARVEMQLDTAGRVPGGNAPAARLDFAGGGSLALTPHGSGRFSATVPAAQLLFDYKADDVNRNFVGFIRLLDVNNAVITSYNAFVNVVDGSIPPVVITTRDSDARQTRRILNLHRPLIKPADVRTAVQQLYAYFPDDFDFLLVVFTSPSYPSKGLIPASQVAGGVVLDGTMCTDCTMPGTTITVQDIIAIHGPRLPDPGTSKKSFRTGTVVISRDRLLNDDEMAVLEYFAARGEARAPLPFSSGLAKGTTKPFYVATRGLATVDLRLTTAPTRRAARH